MLMIHWIRVWAIYMRCSMKPAWNHEFYFKNNCSLKVNIFNNNIYLHVAFSAYPVWTVLYLYVLHCTYKYCTVLICTALYIFICSALYCTILYCTAMYIFVMLHRNIFNLLYWIELYWADNFRHFKHYLLYFTKHHL